VSSSSPSSGTARITACDDLPVSFWLDDTSDACSDYEIDSLSISMRVVVRNGGLVYDSTFGISHPAVTYNASTGELGFDPLLSGGYYGNGDTVTVTLTDIANTGGCHISSPYTVSFIVDLVPPFVSSMTRPCGAVISSSAFSIGYSLFDSLAGVMMVSDSARATVFRGADSVFHHSALHSGLFSLPFTLEDGDSVRFCVKASDNITFMASECPPNAMDTCCMFYVSLGEPFAWVASPVDSNLDGFTISACECQSATIGIFDSDGIDTLSLVFFIGSLSMEPETLGISDSRLRATYIADTLFLTFSPRTGECWSECDLVLFGLLEATDFMGNPFRSLL
jgi:hypothetical protein